LLLTVTALEKILSLIHYLHLLAAASTAAQGRNKEAAFQICPL